MNGIRYSASTRETVQGASGADAGRLSGGDAFVTASIVSVGEKSIF
jgi:hypothetical protein